MKTDTTKFLAVLAVFAMAFAGFALIATDESDATAATVVAEDKEITDYKVITDVPLAENAKDQILKADIAYTLAATLNNSKAFYLLPGAKITVGTTGVAAADLTFAAAYEKNSKYYGTNGASINFVSSKTIPVCTIENVDGVIVITADSKLLTTDVFAANLGATGTVTDLVFKQTGTPDVITADQAIGMTDMTMEFTEAFSVTQAANSTVTLTITGHVNFAGGLTITNATGTTSGNAVTIGTTGAKNCVSGKITNGGASVTVVEWTGNIVKNAESAAGLTIAAPTAGAMTEYTGGTELVKFDKFGATITTTGPIDFDKIYNKTDVVTSLVSINGAASGTLKMGDTTTLTMDAFKGTVGNTTVTSVAAGSLTLVKGTFTVNTESGNTIEIGATLNVASEAVLKVTQNSAARLVVAGALYVAGTIKSTSDDAAVAAAIIKITDGTTDDKSVFKTRAGATMTKINFDSASTGTVDIESVINDVGLAGQIESNNEYTASQLVTLLGDLTIKNKAVIQIHGYLSVPAGYTLKITDGSVLIVDGIYSESEIYGEIEVSKDSALYIKLDKAFDVYGELTTNAGDGKYASLNINSNLNAKDGSTLNLAGATFANFNTTKGILTVEKGATAYISGPVKTGTNALSKTATRAIMNAGTVVFDGAKITKMVSNNTTGFITVTETEGEQAMVWVKMIGNGAVVDIEDLKFNAANGTNYSYLTISDEGIKGSLLYPAAEYYNTMTINPNAAGIGISGLTIGEKASTTIDTDGVEHTKNNMWISGEIAKTGTAENTNVTLNVVQENSTGKVTKYGSFSIEDELELLTDVKLAFGTAKNVAVNGDVTVENGADLTATSVGSIAVKGSIDSYEPLSAATYTACVGAQFKADTHSYVITTVHAAMTFAAVQEGKVTVTIYGDNTITENMYITANVKMVAGTDAAKITIKKDVTVEVIEGASVAVNFKVNGTLYANVEKNITGNVEADVKVTDGVAAKWTSLANALATSEAGDIIIITNTTLTISDSLVIPEEVTVVIPDGTTTTISDKKTLTVNGSLISDAPITLSGTAKIVVNGLARFIGNNTDTINQKYHIDGAYYTEDNYVYISNLVLASHSEVAKIMIYGKVSESKEVTFALQTIELTTGATLKVSDLVLSGVADINAEKGALSGNVTAAGLDGEAVAIMAFTDYAGLVGNYFSEILGTAFIDEITGTVSVVSGTVTLAFKDSVEATGTLDVLPGAEFVVYEGMEVTLKDGVNTGTIYVAGELTVASDDFVNAGIINVVYDQEDLHAGVLNVSEMTMAIGGIIVDDGAKFNLTGSLAIGIPDTSVDGVATIEGIVNIESASVYIIAYASADVSEMIVNPNSDGASTAKTTEFYINDMLYMTLIAAQNNTVKMYADVIDENVYVDIEELDCSALNTGKAAERCLAWGLTSKDVIGSTEKISIDLDYKLIAIQASWVKGLSLYVDGVRISTPGELKLSVGVHLVSVTVDAGYACDNIGITFNGVAVTPAGIFVEVDDTGSVLAVTGDVYIPEPEPVTPEEKSEWTITTILLVVLVILIAIMAVIVALRLNRS